jgi:hypothetical protein
MCPTCPLCRRDGPAQGAAPAGADACHGGLPPCPYPRVTSRMAWGEAAWRGRRGGPRIRDPRRGVRLSGQEGMAESAPWGHPSRAGSSLCQRPWGIRLRAREGSAHAHLVVRAYPLAGEENRFLLHESMPAGMACEWMPRGLGTDAVTGHGGREPACDGSRDGPAHPWP